MARLMPTLQPRLFENLPPTREETPVHQLNYPTFAGAENTMWHGRARGSVERVSGIDPSRPEGGWNPTLNSPAHVGTFEAASERLLGTAARRTDRDPGGRATYGSGEFRPRGEIMEVAGFGRHGGANSQMIPLRVHDRSMANTPDTPVSDAHANLAAGEYDDSYQQQYAHEAFEAGDIGPGLLDAVIVGDMDVFDEEGVAPDSIANTGGLYYQNTGEDAGSISAVVPSANDLQHWPTEVLEHSDNPAQRRTAEFLRGRGY